MRVVAGALKGRRLVAPPRRSAAVRPTADRVREALFAILGEVRGASVLDLFCGTGALGIEALSRGAARATMVDTGVSLARRNVRELGLAGRAEVVRSDALRYLRRSRRRFDLIFCDPPYRLADRLEGELDSLIPGRLAEGGRLICESAARRPLELSLPLLAERRYGDTLIRIHQRGPGDDGRACGDLPGHLRPGHVRAPGHHRQGRKLFDRVVVGRRQPADSQAADGLHAEERRGFLQQAVAAQGNVEVEVFSTLLVDFAREHGAGAIVKGLRAISDFEYEFEMNQLNRKLAPEIESVYIIASPDYSFLSSTGVKEMATFGGDVSDLVPPPVAEALVERVRR